MIKYADKKKKDEQLYTAPNNEHTVKIQFVFGFFFSRYSLPLLSVNIIRHHPPQRGKQFPFTLFLPLQYFPLAVLINIQPSLPQGAVTGTQVITTHL